MYPLLEAALYSSATIPRYSEDFLYTCPWVICLIIPSFTDSNTLGDRRTPQSLQAYQLVISRKKAHPSLDSWEPRREWRSLMSTSLSVVPIQLNLVRNSESRSALSIAFSLAHSAHTRLRRRITEFSREFCCS